MASWVLEEQSWAAVAEALAVAVVQIFSVHPSAILAHSFKLRSIEHLAQLLELVFSVRPLLVVCSPRVFVALY